MKNVLVISRGILHPTVFCRNQLQKILMDSCKDVQFEFSSDLQKLSGIDTEQYHAVILFFHIKKIEKYLMSSLVSYVDNGGRLFSIHGALASFKGNGPFGRLIGVRFTGHDKIKTIEVTGLRHFFITDELYEFDMPSECDIKLQAGTTPVYWVVNHGMGRVVCLSPGHKASTFKNNDFREIIKIILFKDLELAGSENE